MEYQKLEAQMRIKYGPPFNTICFEDFVVEYINKGNHRCDAIHRKGGPGYSASLNHNDNDEVGSPASTYSSLFAK